MSKTSSPAGSGSDLRVVRKRLADGTIKEYRYPRRPADRTPRIAAGTLDALLAAYRRSPEWAALRPASRSTYSTYLRIFDHRGDMAVTEVTRRLLMDIRDAVAVKRGNGAGNGFLNTAAALFAWAVKREWVQASPATAIERLPGGHIRPWSESDLAQALATLAEPYRRVVVLAAHTGQRRGDLCRLAWSSYDGRCLRLVQGKTGVRLVLPVHSALRAELDAWRREARDSVLILTPPRAGAWQPNHLSEAMKRVLEAAGLPDLSVHGLRKLAAVRLAEAGCSVHEISAILGWRTLAMAELYTRAVEQERLAESAVIRLETARVKPRETGR